MRVRIRRFQSDDQGFPPSHDAPRKTHPWHPMLPIQVLQVIHSPIRGHHGYLRLGGRVPADRFSPSREVQTSGIFVSTGDHSPPARCSATMASADFPRHFLPGISPDKSMLLPDTTAAFTSVANQRASLCCASSPHHVGLVCDFCPSAHRFPLAFLPLFGYPHRVGFT